MNKKNLINARIFSQSRPTQAYYVPRKLSECQRGSHTVTENKFSSALTGNSTDSVQSQQKNVVKSRSILEKASDQTEVRLTSEQIWKPNHVKEKDHLTRRSTSRVLPKQLISNGSNEQQSSQTTVGLAVTVPRVVAPQSRLVRPNNFCPVSTKDSCICDRPNAHVICKRCGLECVGRVQLVCSIHPKKMALMDMRQCPNSYCRSTQILEVPTYLKDNM